MCVCVYEQTDSLGRSEHTTASGFKQCLISIPLAHTQMFLAACTSRDFFFDRGKKNFPQKQSIHTVYQLVTAAFHSCSRWFQTS